MSGALAGVKVLDLTSHVSGPYCTMLLADFGADVIKVERPHSGDDARRMPPFAGGEGAPFMLINRNKRSVVLDLKKPDDLALCRTLVRQADVLVENFKPGTMAQLGLGYEDAAALNPRLIYASISGFGQTGPLSDLGGFDLMIQAMSGLMSICGPADGPPHRLPVPITDIAAGMFGCIGILTALAARQRSGSGQRVDASLFEAGLAFAVYEAAAIFAEGRPPERLGQAHRGAAPYEVFRTADGWLTIGGSTQALWEKLCRTIGAPGLLGDPRFSDNARRVANRAALTPLIQEQLAARPTGDWVAALGAAGIPCGPVWTYDRVLAHEHTRAREMVRSIDHPRAGRGQTLGFPVKLSQTPGALRRPAPLLGEHDGTIRAAAALGDWP